MARTDEQIKKSVVDELYWDSRIDASQTKVTVDNGTVTLSGQVPTYGDRSNARLAASRIAGVEDVVDNLEVSYVSPPELPTDRDIAVRAENILAWEPSVDETNMEVSVSGGVLTLEGTVDAHWKVPFAQNKVSGLRGITRIENKLAVVPAKTVADEVLAEDVVNALDRDMMVNPDGITVEVNDGYVTLSGSVPTWACRQAAEEDASLTAGTIGVINNLRINL
jgi:osmotically-inducible protein OsmY